MKHQVNEHLQNRPRMQAEQTMVQHNAMLVFALISECSQRETAWYGLPVTTMYCLSQLEALTVAVNYIVLMLCNFGHCVFSGVLPYFVW